jgi:hypothetical protein
MDHGVNGKASQGTQAGVHDYGLVADRIVTTFVIEEHQRRQATSDGGAE